MMTMIKGERWFNDIFLKASDRLCTALADLTTIANLPPAVKVPMKTTRDAR